MPISSRDGGPLFDWDGDTLIWLEHLRQLVIQREKEAFLQGVRPLDKGENRARLCFVGPCQGVQVLGGQIVRHLRDTHGLQLEAARSWKTHLKDKIRDISYDQSLLDYARTFQADEGTGKFSTLMI